MTLYQDAYCPSLIPSVPPRHAFEVFFFFFFLFSFFFFSHIYNFSHILTIPTFSCLSLCLYIHTYIYIYIYIYSRICFTVLTMQENSSILLAGVCGQNCVY